MSASQTAVTSGIEIAAALSQVNGVVKEVSEVKNAPAVPPPARPKQRSKYRHVAALHFKQQPSCLSHESEATPSFLGFRNLMVLTISMSRD